MKVLGLRLSNTDYTFAVLDGPKDSPNVVNKGTVNFPQGFSRPDAMKWLYQDLKDLIQEHHVKKVALKKAEGNARKSKSLLERVEGEGVALLVAAKMGIRRVPQKVKSTTAKDLGLTGKGHYLKSAFANTNLSAFDNEPEKIKEAIWVGWSELG